MKTVNDRVGRNNRGPWENSPHNPIIRTWDRDEAWWSKGHGTLVEGPGNNWYCVLHGYMNGYRTLGRCTLIEPIQWITDGWFRAADGWPNEAKDFSGEGVMPLSDEFNGEQLGIQWQFHRQFDDARYELESGSLALSGFGDTPGLSRPLSMMAMHRACEIETEVEITGEGLAGLMLFGAPDVYIGLAISPARKLQRIQDGFRRYGRSDEPEIARSRVTLRIVNDKQDVRFYYKSTDGDWIILQPGMDVSSMTTVGWHVLRPALFSTGAATARFHYFRYQLLED